MILMKLKRNFVLYAVSNLLKLYLFDHLHRFDLYALLVSMFSFFLYQSWSFKNIDEMNSLKGLFHS